MLEATDVQIKNWRLIFCVKKGKICNIFLISSMKILKVHKYLNINRNVTGFLSQCIEFLGQKISKKLNKSR